ncbi:MAG: hypothetical protein GKC53_01600 [Neisseriaceae bacterium]|nr:MAG: hypothetical protein GKC53_01600 [Neisseriaceae bacterium]
MISLKRYLFLLALLLLLVSCGFHLRGVGTNVGLKYSIWHIVNGGEITQPLKKELLRRSGVTIQESDVAAVIQFTRIDFNRQTQSINRYGGVDDFLYTLHVKCQIYYKNQPWGEPIDVVVERYMRHHIDSLVAQEEEQHLRNEMYASVADTIVNRLYFLPDL